MEDHGGLSAQSLAATEHTLWFQLLLHALELDLTEHADLRQLIPKERRDDNAADVCRAPDRETSSLLASAAICNHTRSMKQP